MWHSSSHLLVPHPPLSLVIRPVHYTAHYTYTYTYSFNLYKRRFTYRLHSKERPKGIHVP